MVCTTPLYNTPPIHKHYIELLLHIYTMGTTTNIYYASTLHPRFRDLTKSEDMVELRKGQDGSKPPRQRRTTV